MPCDPKILADVDLFELVSDEDRELLAQIIDARSLSGGEILYRAGEPGESLFVVRSGEIERSIRDTAGQEIQLSIHSDNDIFGELALIERAPRSATATALTDTELLELDREDLLVLFEKSPPAALRLLAAMGHMTRKADDLLRTRVSRNANVEAEEKITFLQRVADWISWFSGSMPFLLLNLVWFVIWIAINTLHLGIEEFDPYPFGLLTMIVSLEAIFLSTFVMISQNRQAQRGDIRNQIDFENNIRSEIWSVHVGHALGLDVDHVEQVVQLAIEGAERALKEAQAAPG